MLIEIGEHKKINTFIKSWDVLLTESLNSLLSLKEDTTPSEACWTHSIKSWYKSFEEFIFDRLKRPSSLDFHSNRIRRNKKLHHI